MDDRAREELRSLAALALKPARVTRYNGDRRASYAGDVTAIASASRQLAAAVLRLVPPPDSPTGRPVCPVPDWFDPRRP